MTRGQREGQLVKADLIDRLIDDVLKRLDVSDASDLQLHENVKKALDAFNSRDVLYGCAASGRLLTDLERDQSCPKTTSTIPCYLYSHVLDSTIRDAIDRYVLAWSLLFERGSDIANIIMARTKDTSLRDIDDLDILEESSRHQNLDAIANYLLDENILKQCFLPERWPTESVARHELVEEVMTLAEDRLSHLLPDWKSVMVATGWDNALNRMASKYLANVKVMVQYDIVKRCGDYAVLVLTRRNAFEYPTNLDLSGFQSAVRANVEHRPRPLIVHDDEYRLLMHLRHDILGCPPSDPTWLPNRKPPFTTALFKQHVVMACVLGRPTLPAVSRGRHFAYLDAKILDSLLASAFAGNARRKKEVLRNGTSCMESVFGSSSRSFNSTRRCIRRRVRRRYRRLYGRDKSIRSLDKLRRKWRRLGRGSLPRNASVHSVETDGVGLRLVIQRPDTKAIARLPTVVDITPIQQVLKIMVESKTVESAIKIVKAQRRRAFKEAGKKASTRSPPSLSEQWRLEDGECPRSILPPAFAGGDTGRCKIQTTAVTSSSRQRPSTLTLTRKRYYAAMRYWKHRRWERNRVKAPVRAALTALSDVASLPALEAPRTSVAQLLATKTVEAQYWDVLYNEYIVDKDRALWKMRMLRRKKSCLDRACLDIVREATGGDKRRDFVLGVGDGGFSSTGKGELPVPTSAWSTALRRMKARRDVLLGHGGGRTALLTVWEFRTTVCCCGCGAQTTPAVVNTSQGRRPSRRLRACTSCDETRCRLRDRDVNAARNILWLTMYAFYDAERPWYLCRDS